MRSQEQFTVRHLQAGDVYAVLQVIKECRVEYGLNGRVEAILEPTDLDLLETYSNRR